jgi:hypothetical protein
MVDKSFGSVDRTFWFGRFVLHSATAIAPSAKIEKLK